MKKLFNLFNTQNQNEAPKTNADKDHATKPTNKNKADGKNGEVTPGTLFEHYQDVLIRPGQILDNLEK